MYCRSSAAQTVTLCQSSTIVGLKTKCLPLLFCPFCQDCKHKDIWDNRGTLQLELLAEQGLKMWSEDQGQKPSSLHNVSPIDFLGNVWCWSPEQTVLHGGICRPGTVVQVSAELHLWPYCLYFRTRAQGKGPEVQWQWVCLSGIVGPYLEAVPTTEQEMLKALIPSNAVWYIVYGHCTKTRYLGKRAACLSPQRRQQTANVTEADTKNTFPNWHL